MPPRSTMSAVCDISKSIQTRSRTASGLFIVVACALPQPPVAHAIGTVGSFLNSLSTQGPNLTSATWTTTIDQYDGPPSQNFALRIDFLFVRLTGSSGDCGLTMAIQNVFHTFTDDSNTVTSVPPGLGLYWSSLQPGVPNGVHLDASPDQPPLFGRVFENVDGNGVVGNNIYNRQSLRIPTAGNPVIVQWTVQRIGIVTDPPENLTKDLSGNWVPLLGTFVQWQCQAVVDGVAFNIATYYLPLDRAEFIAGTNPITPAQEHFEVNGDSLNLRLTQVEYSGFVVSGGATQFPLQSWWITSRIDDQLGNADSRFGWFASGNSLVSVCGHSGDATGAFRDVGATFFLGNAASCVSPMLPAECDTDCNHNGIGDACDIANGTSHDCNSNGIPDECELANVTFVSQPDAFCIQQGVHGVSYAVYPDLRAGSSGPPPPPTPVAMTFAGERTLPAGDVSFSGSTFVEPGDSFPYVQHDAARGLLILHPGSLAGWPAAACVSFTTSVASSLRFFGDFARANDFQDAGDGVTVIAFKNDLVNQPLFSSQISSSFAVDPDQIFAGPSVHHFDFVANLAPGDAIRFAVFPGPPGDADFSFDATALRLSIATTNPTSGCILGDLNGDCAKNGRDISEFVRCLLTGQNPAGRCACGDLNQNGITDVADIPLFASALLQ